MKKKVLYSLAIISTCSGLMLYVWNYMTSLSINKLPPININELKTITIEGVEYKTTGSIIWSDKQSQQSLKKIIELGQKGVVKEKGFIIYPSKKGKIIIEINKPYDTNTNLFHKWLVSNRFEEIASTNFEFVYK